MVRGFTARVRVVNRKALLARIAGQPERRQAVLFGGVIGACKQISRPRPIRGLRPGRAHAWQTGSPRMQFTAGPGSIPGPGASPITGKSYYGCAFARAHSRRRANMDAKVPCRRREPKPDGRQARRGDKGPAASGPPGAGSFEDPTNRRRKPCKRLQSPARRRGR